MAQPPPPPSIMPPWTAPSDASPKLHVLNSLTRTKVPFVPTRGDNRVNWYMCGPTVYDASHMGHARTYLGFDIIRRIMTQYFHYDVNLVMNITDIDDKIIKRSNEQGIDFSELARYWEGEYLKDMEALNVAVPDVMTRVSEFMPEIIEYVSTIISNDFAYESNGSVYFNTSNFHGSDNHHYCKLCPEALNNAEQLEAGMKEGEGVLSQDFGTDKKSGSDFALWKKAKEGEPSWDSPWGKGRPGWHIECSVMASNIFKKMGVPGGAMDVHSGGVDLKFPHHDNEIAQAEAESGLNQWCTYFLHAGHLHISGLKMSKSLKNFIKINEALKSNTARQIRMCFLCHKYNDPMDYGDNTVQHAVSIEKIFNEFFLNAKSKLRDCKLSDSQKWGDEEAKLGLALESAKSKVHAALCDDFDTPAVIKALQDLVAAGNQYMATAGTVVNLILRATAVYITEIFKVFGLIKNGPEIGFPIGDNEGGADKEETLGPVLDAVLKFRQSIRSAAKNSGDKEALKMCDALRDDILPQLGIRLEDKEGSEGTWKLVSAEELMREKEQQELERQRKQMEKDARAKEQAEKDRMNALSPEEFMKQLTLEDGKTVKYSKFGDDGLPTHDSKGEELQKSSIKKAGKEFQTQKKKYEKFLAKQQK